jgi:hypothetical protein
LDQQLVLAVNVKYQYALSRRFSVGVGLVAAHAISRPVKDGLYTAVAIIGFRPAGRYLEGLYLSAHPGVGLWSQSSFQPNIETSPMEAHLIGVVTCGYQWIFPSGLVLDVGLAAMAPFPRFLVAPHPSIFIGYSF